MKPRAIAAAILAIAAVCVWLAWTRTPPPPASFSEEVTTTAAPGWGSPASRAPTQAPKSALTQAPVREDSLRGTQVDGAVHRDASGLPVADRDLRRMFDYFLARLGERDEAAIRNDLFAHLRDALHLSVAAQAQVLAWFDAYVATERAATQLPRSGNLADDLAQLRALHAERLGAELARAFYGSEDDYAAYTAQRLALEHDTALSPAQREAALRELEAQLDPAQRASRDAGTDFQLAVAQTEQFAVDGADARTRHDERSALWGEAAAQRLDALDRQEAQWNARLVAYAHAREAVMADHALDAAQRDARLAALLKEFGEAERGRVLALAEAGLLPKD